MASFRLQSQTGRTLESPSFVAQEHEVVQEREDADQARKERRAPDQSCKAVDAIAASQFSGIARLQRSKLGLEGMSLQTAEGKISDCKVIRAETRRVRQTPDPTGISISLS